MPHVISGLKLLRKKLPKAKIYMVTNQSGIAIKNFPLLTPKKATIVCDYVLEQLKKRGAKLDGYEFCGYVTPDYVKRKPNFKFNKK